MEFKRVNSTLETRAVQAFMPNTESGVRGAVLGAKQKKAEAKKRGIEDFVQAAHRFAGALQGAAITRDSSERAERNAEQAKRERDQAFADSIAADRAAQEQARQQEQERREAEKALAAEKERQARIAAAEKEQARIAEAKEREKKAQDSHQGTLYTITAMGVMDGLQLATYDTPNAAQNAYDDAMKKSREKLTEFYGESKFDTGAIDMKVAETDHKAKTEIYNQWFKASDRSVEASVAATMGILSDNAVVDEATYRKEADALKGIKTDGEIEKLVQTAMKQGANTAFRRDVAQLRNDMDATLSATFKQAIEDGKSVEQAQEAAQERAEKLMSGYFDDLDKEALNAGTVAEKERSVNRQGRTLIAQMVDRAVREEARANAKTSAGMSAAGLAKALNVQELEELRSLREDDGQDLGAFSRGTRDFVSAMQSATLADDARDTIENSAWGASRGLTKAVVANDLGVLDMSKLEDRRTAAKILQKVAGYLTRAEMDELNEQVWGQIDALSQGKVDDVIIKQEVFSFIQRNKMFGVGKKDKPQDLSAEGKEFMIQMAKDLRTQPRQAYEDRLRAMSREYYNPATKSVSSAMFRSAYSSMTALDNIREIERVRDGFKEKAVRNKEKAVRNKETSEAGEDVALPMNDEDDARAQRSAYRNEVEAGKAFMDAQKRAGFGLR